MTDDLRWGDGGGNLSSMAFSNNQDVWSFGNMAV